MEFSTEEALGVIIDVITLPVTILAIYVCFYNIVVPNIIVMIEGWF